jgi:hypothetical protein
MQPQGDILQHVFLAPATAAATLPGPVNMPGPAVQHQVQQVLLHACTQLPPAAPALQAVAQTTTGLTLQQGIYPF